MIAKTVEETGRRDLPPGYPSKLAGPLAWNGADFDGKPELFCTYLSKDEILHIDAAVEHFKGKQDSPLRPTLPLRRLMMAHHSRAWSRPRLRESRYLPTARRARQTHP